MNELPVISAQGLRVVKGGRAVCHVDELRVTRGARLAVIGDNGSGKTSLLRALAGLERNVLGTWEVRAPATECVYVHQHPWMLRGTVRANVLHPLRARRWAARVRDAQVARWLDTLAIGHLAEQSARQLSGGERRRVALARAMVLEPSVLLLDEPFAELDGKGSETVRAAMDVLASTTLIWSSPRAVTEMEGDALTLSPVPLDS